MNCCKYFPGIFQYNSVWSLFIMISIAVDEKYLVNNKFNDFRYYRDTVTEANVNFRKFPKNRNVKAKS